MAAARAALAEFAANAGASADQVDGVRLAASEAVTNAVLHAYRGEPGQIQVTAALAGRELWILVSDEGGGMQPRADRPGLGLGLGLISQVCDDMAIVPRSAGARRCASCSSWPSRPRPGAEPSAVNRSTRRTGALAPGPRPRSSVSAPAPQVSAVPAAPLAD